MEDYKPNSHKSKEEFLPEKKIQKVISGTAKTKKKGGLQKITDVFISKDVENVKSYVILDVLVPAIKKAVSDIVTNGIDMILYGETGKTKKNTVASKVSYRSFYESDNDRRYNYSSPSTRRGFDCEDILFESRGDAELVLDAMSEIISQYGVVSVGDLYDLAHISTDNYTANKYGWTNISRCLPVRTRDGYILKMPKAMPIN